MSLNIKSENAHRHAKELARLTRETTTETADKAITVRLERIRRNRKQAALVVRLLEIGRECAALPALDPRRPEEMLDDERGLPKRLWWILQR
jgi:hypothetical protein